MISLCLQKKGRTSMLACAALIAAATGIRPANADSTVGNGTDTSCTRGAFIAAVLGGGEIKFNCGPAPHTIKLISVIEIHRNTTIKGGGKITLKASDTNIFKVASGKTLTLEDINLIDGKASKGGAIENLGTTSISGVTFANNTATDRGGAILNNGTLIVSGSTFRENTATKDGGAIGSDFIQGVTLTITNSTFLDNSAGTDGGALAVNGNTTAELSTFSGNEAEGVGGAILGTGNLTIDRSTLIGNQARGSLSGRGGGGIAYLTSGINDLLTVTESTLNGNRALEGGGIYADGDAIYTNSTLSGNRSVGLGGGLYHNNGRSSMRFMTVANNLAINLGGTEGVHVATGTLSFQNTILSNNTDENSANCTGETREIISLGNNLLSDDSCKESFVEPGDRSSVDAKLGILDNNGGPTMTHLPQADSPAIDAAVMVDGIATDQRRLPRPRPQDGKPDIGSVEAK